MYEVESVAHFLVYGGAVAVGAHLVLSLVGLFISCIWMWLDDRLGAEEPPNAYLASLMYLGGYRLARRYPDNPESYLRYCKRDAQDNVHICDGGPVFLGGLMFSPFIGAFLAYCVLQPIVLITTIIAVGLLFFARKGMRLHKQLQEHIRDREAHK